MTKFEALGPFAFVPTKGQKACSVGKSSLVKTACIVFVFCVAAAIASPAQTLTTLFSFDRGSSINGYSPVGSLVQGVDGNFYGTTAFGGDSGCTEYYETYNGCGTVFKITPGGTLTTLHSFDGSDGAFPLSGGLVQAYRRQLLRDNRLRRGYPGTVFKITASGTPLTTLYSFDGTDGDLPFRRAGPRRFDGNFYGTTLAGGLSGCGTVAEVGCGTVFKITAERHADHAAQLRRHVTAPYPEAGLVQGTDGNFYGTTSRRG